MSVYGSGVLLTEINEKTAIRDSFRNKDSAQESFFEKMIIPAQKNGRKVEES